MYLGYSPADVDGLTEERFEYLAAWIDRHEATMREG